MAFLSNPTLHRLARFMVVGAFHGVAGYLVYLALLPSVPYSVAFTAAFVFGILLSYVLNSLIVFRVRTSIHGFLGFAIYCVFSYLASLGVITCLIEFFKIDPRFAPLISIVPMTFVNFVAAKNILRLLAKPSEG